jgi:hypothetical protein
MIVLGIIGTGQITDHNTLGAGSVDHLPFTNIDTDMGHTLTVCILQKHQITGTQI